MVFGHSISFSEYSKWDETPILGKHISVTPTSLPSFAYVTAWSMHLNLHIRYFSHIPFTNTVQNKPITWAMHIEDVMVLIWNPETKTIGYIKEKYFSLETLRFWVYHTFLPLVFQLEGVYHILHVGGVQIEEYATLFLAPAFGGKSTLTASFLEEGYALLGDDTVAIEKRNSHYYATASYPFYRPFREVGTLGYEATNYVEKSISKIVLFSLERVEAHRSVNIVEVEGIEKFQILHRSAFVPVAFLKASIFTFEMMFLKEIKLYKITVPWGLENLSNVKSSIIKHIKNLK